MEPNSPGPGLQGTVIKMNIEVFKIGCIQEKRTIFQEKFGNWRIPAISACE